VARVPAGLRQRLIRLISAGALRGRRSRETFRSASWSAAASVSDDRSSPRQKHPQEDAPLSSRSSSSTSASHLTDRHVLRLVALRHPRRGAAPTRILAVPRRACRATAIHVDPRRFRRRRRRRRRRREEHEEKRGTSRHDAFRSTDESSINRRRHSDRPLFVPFVGSDSLPQPS